MEIYSLISTYLFFLWKNKALTWAFWGMDIIYESLSAGLGACLHN